MDSHLLVTGAKPFYETGPIRAGSRGGGRPKSPGPGPPTRRGASHQIGYFFFNFWKFCFSKNKTHSTICIFVENKKIHLCNLELFTTRNIVRFGCRVPNISRSRLRTVTIYFVADHNMPLLTSGCITSIRFFRMLLLCSSTVNSGVFNNRQMTNKYNS